MQKSDDNIEGLITSTHPVIPESRVPLSEQLASLRRYLKDVIETWQNLDGDDIIPTSSTGVPTSSSVPSIVKKNQHGIETEPGSSQALASSSLVGYTKLKTASDMSGELYEVKMVALLFLRGVNRAQHFYLGANMDAAGQFDDVIFRLKLANENEWFTNFIQLKHKMNANVTQPALLSLSKNSFGIVKYCHSYLGVKSKMEESQDLQFCGPFEKINFVIYTNAYVDSDLQKPDRKLVSDLGTPFISTWSKSKKNEINTKNKKKTEERKSLMFRLDPFLDGVIYQGLEEIAAFKTILVELNRCFDYDQDNVSRVLDSLESFVVTRQSISGELVRIVDKVKQDLENNKIKETVRSVLGKELFTVTNFSSYQEFMEKLQIFTGQANEKELDDLIKEEINFALKVSDDKVLQKMLLQITNDVKDWWRQDDPYYLTEDATFWREVVSSHIAELSSETVRELQECELSFNDTDLEPIKQIVSNSGVSNMCTQDGSSFLTMLKVYQALEGGCCIFVGLDSLHTRRKEILCTWQKRQCRKLVVDCRAESQPVLDIPRPLYDDLYRVLKDVTGDLALILVSTSAENPLVASLRETLVVEDHDEVNRWAHLSPSSRAALLKRDVAFQGWTIPFASLAGNDGRLTDCLKGNALTQLLASQLDVGPVLQDPVEYYVSRRLVRDGFDPFYVRSTSDAPGRAVLIIAEPGMGKTTLLSHLAVETKRNDPTKWVVRINLNDCTTYLSGLKSVPIQEMESVRFLVKNVLTNGTVLEDTLFKHALQTANNVVVLVDSVDEVCPLYENEVCFLLKHLLDTRIEKLWVTSRATPKEMLEQTLNTSAFSLVPFTRKDQENFLCMYWNRKMCSVETGPKDLNDVGKLREFAIQVLNLAADVFEGNDLVISIPQQTLMLAELFEVEFTNYCRGVGATELPKRLDVILLYESFVQKKFDVYVYEKKKASRDNAAVFVDNECTFDVFRKNHMAASLALLFTQDERRFLPSFSEFGMQSFLKMVEEGREKNGIIVGMAEDLPRFVHRTFAEYFAAVWFVEKRMSIREFLKRHLFESRFSVVRNFFDSTLARDCPLHLAVLNRDVDTLKGLLSEGLDANVCDAGGRTALHLAATEGVEDCANALLERGAVTDAVDELFEWRPLRYADRTEVWTVAGMILKNGGLCEDLVESGRRMADEVFREFSAHLLLGTETSTARLLLAASRHGDLTTVEYAVNVCGGDVGAGAMQAAAGGGHIPVLTFLVLRGASHVDPDADGNLPLHSAVASERREAIAFLLDCGSPIDAPDRHGRSALTVASALGSVDVVTLLLARGADVDARSFDDSSPVLCAAEGGHVDCLKLLLAAGAEVAVVASETEVKANSISLLCVSFMEVANSVRYLPENKAVTSLKLPFTEKVVSNGYCSLQEMDNFVPCISFHSNLELAKQLLENGACVNYHNKKGKSALHYAVLANCYQLTKLLIEKGANINARDNQGICPLHCIADSGLPSESRENNSSRIALMHLLLKSGADIMLRTYDGSSFRDIVSKRGLADIIQYFSPLDEKLASAFKGGDVNAIKDLVGIGARFDPLNTDVHPVLTTAAREGNLDVAKPLLESGAEINTCDAYKRSLLLLATSNLKWDMVKYLVKTGGDCLVADKDGYSLLHKSLHEPEVVRLLCDNGADVNVLDQFGKSPLLAAVEASLRETASVLIDRGADVDASDVLGRSPIRVACDNLDLETIRLLLEKGCDPGTSDTTGFTPLMTAARLKCLEVVEVLVEGGAEVDAVGTGGQSALHVACSVPWNLEVVRFLVEHGADASRRDRSGRTPIVCAADATAWDTLAYLAGRGVDVNACDDDGRAAIHLSVQDLDSVKLLVANGADVDLSARTPLLCAVFAEQWDTAEFLAGKGAEVNVSDAFGYSAFHLASDSKGFDTMRVLAENGANPNTRNKDGLSPLLSAMLTGSREAAKLCVQLGSDPTERDRYGRSPFHAASDADDLEMMAFLLEKGVDVHTSDSEGKTPLMSAVQERRFACAMFLLDRGVGLEAVDSDARSALDVACDMRDENMIQFLVGRGLRKGVYHGCVWKPLILFAAKVDAWDVVALCLRMPNAARHGKPGEFALSWAIDTRVPVIVKFVTEHLEEFSYVKISPEEMETGGEDYDVRVPLFVAVKGGHLDLLTYLADNGADFGVLDVRRRSILFEACSSGRLDVVEFLLAHGVDPNARDQDARSPLFVAAGLGHAEIVSCLIQNGAVPDARDHNGETTLLEATECDKPEVVRCLLDTERT